MKFLLNSMNAAALLREGAAGGGGEGEESRRARALGWEAARPCVSKEAKPAKIVSLIEKDFCARQLKEKEIFAGFAGRRQAAEPLGGMPRSAPPQSGGAEMSMPCLWCGTIQPPEFLIK